MEELLIQMQQAKKEQEAEYLRRRSFVRVALILIVILILLRILGIAQGGVLPVELAVAGTGAEGPLPQPVGASTAMRVEWLGYCDPARIGLAAYAAHDVPCSPSQVISLPTLQEQLTAASVLQKGEYLTLATQTSAACRVAVVNGENGQITGWLCAEKNGSGLYRTDASGQNPGPCWQLWSDGKWQLPGQV